jgi:hypothetical protein
MYNECRHIFTSGKKCQSPALKNQGKDQDFCYFHQANRQRSNTSRRSGQPSTLVHHLPPLEDADAIQLAISDVVLALAANRIDPRRAQILIYGLQVASQTNRQRHAIETAEEAKERACPARSRIVSEAHVHQDGSLIGPSLQRPDPDEIPEKKVPSLGRILLKEAEALKAQRMAEQEAQEKTAAAEQPADVSHLPGIVNLQATADMPPAKSCHRPAGRTCRVWGIGFRSDRKDSCDCSNSRSAREAAWLQSRVIEHGILKSVRKATIEQIWERLDFHSDRLQAARDLMSPLQSIRL